MKIKFFHREKPHEPEWNDLEKMKVPLLLNFCQCKLIEGDFYPVIEHCTTVLKTEPGWNLKILKLQIELFFSF